MKAIFATLAASALAVLPVVAQVADPEDDAIIVQGERPYSEKEVKSLARKLGANIDLLRPIPRFNDPLCLDVAGLKDEYRDRFARRLIENAKRADIRVAKEGCRPNAMVMFAEDSRSQLESLRKRNRFLFGEMPRSEFRDLLNSRDGVYAWQINEVIGLSELPFDSNSGFGVGTPVNRTLEVGRLNPPIRIVTRSSVVVIERSQLGGKTPEQLADYATMRLVAPTVELPAGTVAGPQTIMTLFSDPANAPAELTAFDSAYLESVYNIRVNGPSGRVFVETAALVTSQTGQ
jgi:hypothetical protein